MIRSPSCLRPRARAGRLRALGALACAGALLAASGARAQPAAPGASEDAAAATGPARPNAATGSARSTAAAASSQPAGPAAVPAPGEVVVTAARQPQRVDETVSDVTVIGRAQIERAAGRSLAALLAEQPGVQVTTFGGLGTTASVFLRGAEARHTLLLVDGVRYGSATAGLPSLDNLPLDQIERIEIVRGPMSSLYGADAAGGVIQVFTRRGRDGSRPQVQVTLGSNRYVGAGGGFGGATQDGAVDYSLHVQRQRTAGFSATNPREPFGNFHPDRDGFDQTSLSLNLGARLGADWRARGFFLGADGTTHFDDGQPASDPNVDTRAKLRTRVGGLQLDGRVASFWRTRLAVGQSEDVNDTVVAANAFSLGSFRTAQTQLTWQNDLASPLGTVLVAAEQLRQRVSSSSTAFAVSQRTINALVLGLNGAAGAHHWQASARNDRNSQFGDQTTGSVGYGYDLTPRWRIGAAAGTSFVAPSFILLYYPGGFGNPDLQPERGRQRELSVRYASGSHQVRLTAFDHRIRGFITPGINPVNVDRARIDGLTLAYTGRFGPLALSASMDMLDPRDETTGRQLPRRSARAFASSADWTAGAWAVGATLAGVGSRYDDTANTPSARLAGYGLVGLRARVDLSRDWQLSARIDNLTDRAVENVLGYNQPRRELYVTLRWMPR